MILGYDLRLLCVCLASFFLVNAVAGIAIAFASSAVTRIAATMRARTATRFLFAVRMLPFALGIVTVLALCVPSYLWLEPDSSGERMGWVSLTISLLAAISLLISMGRAMRAAVISARFDSAKRQAGSEVCLPSDGTKAVVAGKDAPVFAVVIERDSPVFAIVGIFRPCVVISRSVLRALSAGQLQLALRHENAHRISRDNLKRLLLLLAPAPLPFFRGFTSIERQWAKFSEWAADDEAVLGDSRTAVSFAEALLQVARLGTAQRLPSLHTALIAGDRDLEERVDRLLHVRALPTRPPFRTRTLAIGSSLGMAACTAAALVWPGALSSIHKLLEVFLR
jgi:beta-lactamase regulating signal transducer with metallopeptidase domain